jgi:hypothetical protein
MLRPAVPAESGRGRTHRRRLDVICLPGSPG